MHAFCGVPNRKAELVGQRMDPYEVSIVEPSRIRSASLRKGNGLVYAALIACLFGMAGYGQSPLVDSHQAVAKDTVVTSADAQQRAQQAFQQSLDAMGGHAAWAAVKSVGMRGSSTVDGKPSHEIVAEDDWVKVKHRSRREVHTPDGNNVQTLDENRRYLNSALAPGPINHAVKRVIDVPLHIPGRTIDQMLNAGSLPVSVVPCKSEAYPQDVCITITHADVLPYPDMGKQEWLINPETHLPDAVRYYLNTLSQKPQIEVNYLHYTQQGQLSFPDQLDVRTLNSKDHIVVAGIELNRTMPDTDFSSEEQR